ncbi:hypothetical protein FZEAL_4319, partial [Fusarium zealandicum]
MWVESPRAAHSDKYVPSLEVGWTERWQDKLLARRSDGMAGLGRAGVRIWTVTEDSDSNLGVPLFGVVVVWREWKREKAAWELRRSDTIRDPVAMEPEVPWNL